MVTNSMMLLTLWWLHWEEEPLKHAAICAAWMVAAEWPRKKSDRYSALLSRFLARDWSMSKTRLDSAMSWMLYSGTLALKTWESLPDQRYLKSSLAARKSCRTEQKSLACNSFTALWELHGVVSQDLCHLIPTIVGTPLIRSTVWVEDLGNALIT